MKWGQNLLIFHSKLRKMGKSFIHVFHDSRKWWNVKSRHNLLIFHSKLRKMGKIVIQKISRFPQMVKHEFPFMLVSRKFWSQPITISILETKKFHKFNLKTFSIGCLIIFVQDCTFFYILAFVYKLELEWQKCSNMTWPRSDFLLLF